MFGSNLTIVVMLIGNTCWVSDTNTLLEERGPRKGSFSKSLSSKRVPKGTLAAQLVKDETCELKSALLVALSNLNKRKTPGHHDAKVQGIRGWPKLNKEYGSGLNPQPCV